MYQLIKWILTPKYLLRNTMQNTGRNGSGILGNVWTVPSSSALHKASSSA